MSAIVEFLANVTNSNRCNTKCSTDPGSNKAKIEGCCVKIKKSLMEKIPSQEIRVSINSLTLRAGYAINLLPKSKSKDNLVNNFIDLIDMASGGLITWHQYINFLWKIVQRLIEINGDPAIIADTGQDPMFVDFTFGGKLEDDYISGLRYEACDFYNPTQKVCDIQYLDPERTLLSSYPNRDDVQEHLESFQAIFMENVAVPLGLIASESFTIRNNCTPGMTFMLSKPQQVNNLLIRPGSPYKGTFLFHDVGSGKTCTMLAILHNFMPKPDGLHTKYRRIWVSKTGLLKDVTKNLCCTGFQNMSEETFVKMTHMISYEQFTNALIGRGTKSQTNTLAQEFETEGRKYFVATGSRYKREFTPPTDGKDLLKNTILLIDEAHKMLEPDGDRPPSFELLKAAIEYSYEKSGPDSVRVVLASATPVTRDVTAPFKLLNLLIPNPYARVNTDLKSVTDNFLDGSEAAKEAFGRYFKGLISYYNPEDDQSTFAKRLIKFRTVQMSEDQDALIGKNCVYPALKKTDKQRGDCIRKTMNWAGLQPSRLMPEYQLGRKTYDPNFVRFTIQKYAPKTYDLIQNIIRLNQQDAPNDYKHMIYSDVERGLGAKNIAAGLAAFGFGFVQLNVIGTGKNIKIELTFPPEETKHGYFVVLTKTSLTAKSTGLTVAQMNCAKKLILNVFNSRPCHPFTLEGNVNGRLLRYIILDKFSREGIDIYDTKYVHMFEPSLTPYEFRQATGRSFRRCGQSGLPFAPNEGWSVTIYVYDMEGPPRAMEEWYNEDDVPKISSKTQEQMEAREELIAQGDFTRFDYRAFKSPATLARNYLVDMKQQDDITRLNNLMKYVAIDNGLY